MQLLRKRHIGNDIVTIVFQDEDARPFNPATFRSQYQHLFIVVRVENAGTDSAIYRCVQHQHKGTFTLASVATTRKEDVPYFGPPLQNCFDSKAAESGELRKFLLVKG